MNFENFHTRFVAIALLVAAVLAHVEFSGIFFYLANFPGMLLHELGHAISSFLTGGIGVPFFFISFTIPRTTNTILTLLFLEVALSGVLFLFGKSRWIVSVALVVLIQVLFCTCLSEDQATIFITAGGMAGELILPALLTAFFLIEKPEISTRRFWPPVIVISLYVLISKLLAWIAAIHDPKKIPYASDGEGTFLFQDPFANGGNSPVGDLDIMLKLYNFTRQELVSLYVTIGLASITSLLIITVIALVHEKAFSKDR